MTEKHIILSDIDPLMLYGANNGNLQIIKSLYPKLRIVARDNIIKIIGDEEEMAKLESQIDKMCSHISKYNNIAEEDILDIIKGRTTRKDEIKGVLAYNISGNPIKAKSKNQQQLIDSFNKNDMIFAIGPAGSGKTYLSIALAVKALKEKMVRKIILSRPAVEAGEKLGFLPGDMKDKIDPYLQPLYDSLEDMIPSAKLQDMIEKNVIQIAPLAFMRGRTLNDAIVILDEAQNTTPAQMRMFLTRMGWNTKMIITGDITQIDLPNGHKSGLKEALKILSATEDISFVHFDKKDIVRNKLVTKIVKAYEVFDKSNKTEANSKDKKKETPINYLQNKELIMKALTCTNFNFDGQKSVYHGKVRDVYNINDDLIVMVATDRISAFDVVLPKGIPFKGQVLNQIAAQFLDSTTDICPNWKLATPDPMVTVGLKCEGFKVEMIIRSILTGSAWRDYKNGVREICGIQLPDGMKENERFPEPIITPTTKADEGHDLNISKEEIIAQGLVSAEDYAIMEDYTRKIFARGQEIAAKHGLILVDTKYEFGKRDGKVYLIDEIHTPDSSRYFYAEGYEEKLAKGEPQRQLSKEFVRQWLISHNFMNEPGQVMPEMTDEYINSVSERYIELYEHITGNKFVKPTDSEDINKRIQDNINNYLATRK